MKKVLLASSALVASVAVTAPAAAGEVTWNAFTHFFASSSYEQNGDDEGDIQDFNTNSEIHLKFEDTADNGLTYGFKIELEADQGNTNNVDENYIFLSGDWGRVELGDNDGAADQLDVVATSGFTYGMLNNSTGGTFNAFDSDGTRNTRTAANLADSGDNTKITYLTPSFSGFTAGVSYAPEANEGNSVADAGTENQFEAGINYSGDFDGFGLTAAITGTYEEQDAQDRDNTGIQAGVEVSVAGFTVGLAAAHIDNEDVSEIDTVNFGVSYSAGAWTVAGGALYSEYEPDGSAADEELTAVTAGVSYNIAPGLTASLGGTYGENEVDGGDDNEFNTVVAGIQVSF